MNLYWQLISTALIFVNIFHSVVHCTEKFILYTTEANQQEICSGMHKPSFLGLMHVPGTSQHSNFSQQSSSVLQGSAMHRFSLWVSRYQSTNLLYGKSLASVLVIIQTAIVRINANVMVFMFTSNNVVQIFNCNDYILHQ